MLGPGDYILWIAGPVVELYVVVWTALHRDLLRYFILNLYMLAAALATLGHFLIFRKYGFSSMEYRYFYYYSDSLLTVLLFFAIMELYQHVFGEMGVSKYVRGAAILLLAGTAWFSYMVVHEHQSHLTSRFVVELGQNLYFVGVVLTYLLWVAVMKLRETRTRLIQLVLALGIYFSATAALFALRNMFPGFAAVKLIQPLAGMWLPLAWAFTFTKIPEEARLATARVAASHR